MLRRCLVSGVSRVSALSVTRLPPPSVLSVLRCRFSTEQALRGRTNGFRGSWGPQCGLVFYRSLSLRSIFSHDEPVPVPSPLTVAHISKLEAEANVQPHHVEKQIALYRSLIETRLQTSYQLVISRWERMCEFDPSSPVLHSPVAFELYLTSLVESGQQASVNSAARRRDTLMQSHPLASAAPTMTPTKTPETIANSPEGGIPSISPTLLGKPKASDSTSSQNIALAVLAARAKAKDSPSPSIEHPKVQSAIADGTPIQVSIVERKGAWIPRLLRFVSLMLVSSFFFLVILSVFFESSGLMKKGPQHNTFQVADGNKLTFNDVHGVDEAKEELQDVVMFLKDPSSFATLGGKLPKGILLTGPPGTGKTLLARALAGEAGVPFFFASGSDFEEMFVGVGAKRVRDLFAAARKQEPSIVFIDELDAVGGKRTGREQFMKQTLNQLLVEMDGFEQNEGIIVIAATNFPESLDPALVRPGRFDRTIAVPLPDIRGRVQILKHHMRGVIVAKDADPVLLARGTPGFSGADLQNMVNLAAIQASKEKATEVHFKHFDWAKDRILMGAERRSQYIDPKEKLATAYHEGGHALIAMYTEGAMPLHKVTCIPRGHALGFTSQLPENDQTSVTYKEYLARVDVAMGGRVAEELIYGKDNVTSGASSDIMSATKTATAMVMKWGFSKLGPVFFDDETLSPRLKEQIEEEISKIIHYGQERALDLLTKKLGELHLLAHALVEHETLDAEQVGKVIKGEKLPGVLDEEVAENIT